MSDLRHRGQQLRGLFLWLAVIFLVVAGAAYGVTWYQQTELEADATRDARRLSLDVLQPLLVSADAQGPVRGARYDELLDAVEKRVLAGPINGVLLLAQDGTVLFADQPALVGDQQPALRDDIPRRSPVRRRARSTTAGSARSRCSRSIAADARGRRARQVPHGRSWRSPGAVVPVGLASDPRRHRVLRPRPRNGDRLLRDRGAPAQLGAAAIAVAAPPVRRRRRSASRTRTSPHTCSPLQGRGRGPGAGPRKS